MRRRSLVFLSTAATLGMAGTASAVLTPPTLTTLPPFVRGPVQLTWTATAFTPLSSARSYGLGPPVSATVPEAPAPAFTWATPPEGPASITVTATETPCAVPAAPPTTCTTPGTPETSPPSSAVTTTVDNTAPAGGSISINGGGLYTRDPNVTLTAVTAADPPAGSGVAKMQLAEGASGAFTCTVAGQPECPRDVATSVPYTLSGSGDGFRAVRAVWRDAAVTMGGAGLLADGNVSPEVSDSIFLDRKAPTPVPTASPGSVQTGKAVSFASAATRDDNNNVVDDSGIDTSSFKWSFGSGSTPATGPNATFTFTTAGTKTVTLTVKDKAGNTGTANVPVTVTNPPPVVVTPPVVGGGGAGGGTTGGATPGGGGPAAGGGGGGAAPVPARFVTRLRPVGKIIEGTTMKIALQVRGRVIITVSLVKVRSNGKLGKAVRTFTGLKSGRFGVRFEAPKAGRYRLVARTGGQRRSTPITVLPAPAVPIDPTLPVAPVPAASR